MALFSALTDLYQVENQKLSELDAKGSPEVYFGELEARIRIEENRAYSFWWLNWNAEERIKELLHAELISKQMLKVFEIGRSSVIQFL